MLQLEMEYQVCRELATPPIRNLEYKLIFGF